LSQFVASTATGIISYSQHHTLMYSLQQQKKQLLFCPNMFPNHEADMVWHSSRNTWHFRHAMDVNVAVRDKLSSRDVTCRTIIQTDRTNWSHQAALYRSAGRSKHSRLEHTDHSRPCCIGVQANQNTANWKTVITTVGWNQIVVTSRIVSVCRGTKILSDGTKWPQRVVLYRFAGEKKKKKLSVGTKWPQIVVLYRFAGKQKYCRLEPNDRK